MMFSEHKVHAFCDEGPFEEKTPRNCYFTFELEASLAMSSLKPSLVLPNLRQYSDNN